MSDSSQPRPINHISWGGNCNSIVSPSNKFPMITSGRKTSTKSKPPSTAKFLTINANLLETPEQIMAEPEKIDACYSTDFNILWVHRKILNYFNGRKSRLTQLMSEIAFQNQLREKARKQVDRIAIDKRINEFKNEVYDIENNVKYNEYLKQATQYLELYRQNTPGYRLVSFGRNEDAVIEDDNVTRYRVKIISLYLDVASKYYPIDIRRSCVITSECPICGQDVTEVGVETGGVIECECGYEQAVYTKESMYKDTSRIESNRTDGNYQDRENFEKAIRKFQGKQENVLPPNLLQDLDKWMISYQLPTSAEIKAMELNIDDSRGPTSRDLLFKALKETNYSDYYEDERLILYLLWDWPRPDLSHLEEKLMDDYDLTQFGFNDIDDKNRKSSLNTQYRLFRHTQANECKYTIDDFRVVKTPDILAEHDRLWTIMCQKTDYPLILRYR